MSRRSAHIEAIRHLTKGLQLLHTLPETCERARQELALQMAMGASMLATSGLAIRKPAKRILGRVSCAVNWEKALSYSERLWDCVFFIRRSGNYKPLGN